MIHTLLYCYIVNKEIDWFILIIVIRYIHLWGMSLFRAIFIKIYHNYKMKYNDLCSLNFKNKIKKEFITLQYIT